MLLRAVKLAEPTLRQSTIPALPHPPPFLFLSQYFFAFFFAFFAHIFLHSVCYFFIVTVKPSANLFHSYTYLSLSLSLVFLSLYRSLLFVSCYLGPTFTSAYLRALFSPIYQPAPLLFPWPIASTSLPLCYPFSSTLSPVADAIEVAPSHDRISHPWTGSGTRSKGTRARAGRAKGRGRMRERESEGESGRVVLVDCRDTRTILFRRRIPTSTFYRLSFRNIEEFMGL